MKTYRDNGAVGALLDEYEKAINELKQLIEPLDDDIIARIVDPETKDNDCRSIQTILNHVIHAGYNYIIYLRNHEGEKLNLVKKENYNTAKEFINAIDKMFQFNELFFVDYPDYELEQFDVNKKIAVRWGQNYDGDQMMEHAIVHILRHRRQIERFLLKIKKADA